MHEQRSPPVIALRFHSSAIPALPPSEASCEINYCRVHTFPDFAILEPTSLTKLRTLNVYAIDLTLPIPSNLLRKIDIIFLRYHHDYL